jgi:hypothetical protein
VFIYYILSVITMKYLPITHQIRRLCGTEKIRMPSKRVMDYFF